MTDANGPVKGATKLVGVAIISWLVYRRYS